MRYRLEVDRTVAHGDPNSSALLDNDDLRPLLRRDRTWGVWTYMAFWFSAASSVSDWYSCSSAVAAGLSPLEALFTLFGGRIVSAFVLVLNGRPGAMYHIPYPAVVRASFGVYGSYWPVVSRVVLSVIYQGINMVQGGYCFYVMLHAIFPSIATLPEIMPKDAGITTGVFIGIMFLWVILVASAAMNIPKAKITVHIRVVSFVIAAISMLAWCCTLAGGAGRILAQGGTATGSKHRWLLVKFFFVGLSVQATFATNASDFQRYATRANAPIAGNLLGGPLSNLLVHLVGVVVAASSTLIFGEMQWNPVLILDQIMLDDYSAANRAGAFFIALCFSYGVVISNIFENILPAANDLAGLVPKYVNYRRAAYFVAVIALAINPWYLLSSAAIFVTYMSSFGIFLASIIGVMLAHYYVVCRGRLAVDDLYHSAPSAPYYYWHGFNPRAYAAYLCGIVPSLDGFAGAVGRTIPLSAIHFYIFAYPVGLVVSFSVYLVLCHVWPVPLQQQPLWSRGWLEPKEYYRPGDDVEDAVDVLEGQLPDAASTDVASTEPDGKAGGWRTAVASKFQ